MAFELIKEEFHNQDYRGHAEACVYTFTVNLPDQLGASWSAQQHINATITELQQQGALLLEYRLWEDKLSGTFTTDYKCEIIASASPLFWSIVIVAVLAAIIIGVTAWAIQGVSDIVEYGGAGVSIGFGAVGLALLVFALVYAFGRRRPEEST